MDGGVYICKHPDQNICHTYICTYLQPPLQRALRHRVERGEVRQLGGGWGGGLGAGGLRLEEEEEAGP
jgi:hypothetical protein